MHIYSNFRRRRTDHLTKKRSPQLASSSLLCSKPSSVFLTFVQIWLDLTCRSRRRMTQSLARLNWVWVTPHQPASFDWPPAVIARIRINFCFQTAINERFFLDPPLALLCRVSHLCIWITANISACDGQLVEPPPARDGVIKLLLLLIKPKPSSFSLWLKFAVWPQLLPCSSAKKNTQSWTARQLTVGWPRALHAGFTFISYWLALFVSFFSVRVMILI